MRCPKCGFISFDHLDNCLKCTKQVQETSLDIQGTTFNATSPSFLGTFSENQEPEQEQAVSDDYGEISIAGSDLDVLIDEESTESFDDELSLEELDVKASLPTSDDDEITLADVDDSTAMDLGQFEDGLDDEPAGIDIEPGQLEEKPGDDLVSRDTDFELLEDDFVMTETSEDEGQNVLAMDVPDELADITDLAGPADDQVDLTSFDEDEPVLKDVSAHGMEGDDLADLDLGGLDIDLDLGAESTDSILPEGGISPEKLSDISLSDIDLSDTVGSVGTERKDQQDTSHLDSDLDFDLNLNGIALTDEED